MSMRTPVPVLIVAAPTKWVWRLARAQHRRTVTARKQAAATSKAVEKRLSAIGVPTVASPAPGASSVPAQRQAPAAGVPVPAAAATAVVPAPAVETASAARRSLRERAQLGRRWAYRHRRDVMAPIVVALALVALHDVVHRFPHGWSLTSIALAAGPVAGVLVAGFAWAMRIDPNTSAGLGRRMIALLTTGLGGLWVASPARVPAPFWPHHLTVVPQPTTAWLDLWAGVMPAWPLTWPLLVLVTAAAAWLRWRRFQPRPETATTVQYGMADVFNEKLALEGPLKDFWADPSSETRILDEARGDVGFQFRVDAPDNSTGGIAVAGARNRLAVAFKVRPEWLEFVDTDSLASCWVRVVESATLATSEPWRPGGVDLERGTVEIGNFPDGSRAKLQVWVPGQGAKHLWFTGSTGSGKTGAVSAYLGKVMQTGRVVLDLTDLGETSLPAWMPIAYRCGVSAEDGLMALRRANAVMEARRAAMRAEVWTDRDGITRTGRSTLTPNEEWPLWCTAIEEWPELLTHPEAVVLADRLGRLGRKYAVQLVVVSQAVTLKEAFGNAGVLRTNIQKGGNVVCLANERDASRMALGGAVAVDPSAIPLNKPGLGYVVGPANYRNVMARVDWIDDDEARPAHVPSSWQVAAYARPGTPHPVDVAAVERVERADRERRNRQEQAAQASERAAAVGDATGDVQSPPAVTRQSVEQTLHQLCSEAGRPVALGAVVAALGPKDDTPHYDKVRGLLRQLLQDPESPVTQPGFGKWQWKDAA